tara:strand:- start:605 stop:3013 length:2409 start_codon:yes stop_codon:yes gene_type:complete
MENERRLEILGILTIALSVFILVSLSGYNPSEEPSISSNVQVTNPMGILGIFTSHLFIKLGFGYSTIIIPLLGFVWGWFLFSKKELTEIIRGSAYGLGIMVLISVTVGVLSIQVTGEEPVSYLGSGLVGGVLAELFLDWLSIWGTALFLIAGYLMVIRGYFNLDYYGPFASGKEKWENWRTKEAQKKKQEEKEDEKRKHTQDLKSKIDAQKERDSITNEAKDQEPEQLNIDPEETETVQETEYPEEEIEDDSDVRDDHFIAGKSPGVVADQAGPEEYKSEDHEPELEKGSKEDLNIEEIAKTEEVDIDAVVERQKPKRKYQLPSSELLANPVTISDNLSRDELVERANYLTQSMSTFGVEGKVVNVHPGPIITLFEVEPAEGIRVNKFVQLADDLARVMKASSVRVIAPIPGKSSVGIEIPNKNPATVYFKSVVNSQEFAEASSLLTLAIGKTTSGEISTLNLAKMPHLLIAGTTGSGKSVCINTIICSILYRATPDEVKFVMIDPKKVEMTLFKELDGYHLLKMEDIPEPIVTSVDNAILALRALEKEMDRRYNVLADAVVRNISEYNEKMKKDDEPIMPYIVLVVDELADLMMLSGKDVEAPIARLAQLARAVGIHLVIATQRPSVDVITGVIKANFSSRIAFQVASKIDSRTIIDQQGADKLIGRGDMLHLGTGSSDVIRMHNAFLSLEEIEAVMNHISDQPKPEEIILPSVREAQVSDFGIDGGETGTDELFNEAIALVITHQQGSISLLQRRLKVGYSRAARLIDEMEQTGVVGPFTGSKAREVLVDETYLEMIRDS